MALCISPSSLNILKVYGSYSRLKINTDKTKLVWIGRKRYSMNKIESGKILDWGITEFDLLGITFSVDLSTMEHINFLQFFSTNDIS